MMKSKRTTRHGCPRYFSALASSIVGLILSGASVATWAALHAQLDRDTVQEGDQVTLRIDSDEAHSGERPDVTPLRSDFDVRGTSTSSETSFVNGTRSDRTRWLIQLKPLHVGTITVPPITVGSEHTAAQSLNVTEAPPSDRDAAPRIAKHVFLEVEAPVAGKPIYIQQQIPYTIRLYYDDTIETGDLAAPNPGDAIVEQLGEEKRYSATRDGKRYNVVERRYSVAPEKSGVLLIPPANFRGTLVAGQDDRADVAPGSEDMMDRFLRNTPFANDPFFKRALRGGSAFADSQPVAARSRAITLQVEPRPAGAHGNWLPAEQITLHDSWADDPPRFRAGEPVTRTVTIKAKGIGGAQIPALMIDQPSNATRYPETSENQSETSGDTILGISKQRTTYIPNAQGTIDVPPVELPWWNTQSNTQSLASLPARQYTVEAGIDQTQSRMASPVPGSAAAPAHSTATPMATEHPPQLTQRLQDYWAWLVPGALLAIGALLSGLAIGRAYRPARFVPFAVTMATQPMPLRRDATQALHNACVANDRGAAARALLDLGRVAWPDDPPRGLTALAARLEVGREEVIALERSLYGCDGSSWNGDPLWKAIRRGLQPFRTEAPRHDDGLRPLYS